MRLNRGPGSAAQGAARRATCALAVAVLLLAGAVPVAAEGTRELLVGPLAGFANAAQRLAAADQLDEDA